MGVEASRHCSIGTALPTDKPRKRSSITIEPRASITDTHQNIMASPSAKSLNSHAQERLRQILHDHINKVETFCADCTAPISVATKPWASVNLGVLICMKCSGVHRSLGVHVSQVRNVDLDKWDEESVAAITKKSNVQLNLQYEYHVPPEYRKPNENSPADLRSKYIQAKYRDRLFEKKGHRKRQSAQIDLAVEAADAKIDVGMVEYTGLVLIRLIEAKDLPTMDIGSESDPYVIFSNSADTQRIKSSTIDDNNNPVWNENLTLSVNGLKGPINISVFDADNFTKDDFIGRAAFDISELEDGKPHEYWIPLVDKHDKPLKKNSRLHVELSYVSIL